MNHYQLRRMAVYPLLDRYNLLVYSKIKPEFADASGSDEYKAVNNPATSLRLAEYGLALLKNLCAAVSIEIFSVEDDDAFLQGSLAKFEPHLPDDQSMGGLIYYSRQLDVHERTFAIAHELAHFYLHWGQLTACHRQDLALDTAATADTGEALLSGEVEVYNSHNLREREANSFALELLMPSNEVQVEYQKLRASSNSQNLSLVAQLAQHFGVSPYRMLMQLSNVFLAGPLPLFTLGKSPGYSENIQPLEKQHPAKPLIKLDAEQQAAVQVKTPALVLAGPGSGKTRTLVERVGYLVKGTVENQPIDPAQLLILTFSNKAAGELRERLAGAALPAERMLISTFHAYGVEFLRRYAERAGLARDFRLLDPAHAYMLMEELLPYFPTGYYINPHNPYGYLADLLGDISRAKDYLHTPDEYDQAVARMANAMTDDGKPVYKAEDIDKARERAAIFRVYKEHKQKRNLVDFSDLVLLPVKLLESDHEVLQSERWRYRQVLVDEFQDMNYASGKLLQWLCSPTYGGGGNLWAVGDLNQSIYRFRGAFPQQAGAKAFVRDYGSPALPATILELSCNYRSLPTIVSLANHLRNSMSTDGATLPLQAKREVSSEKVEQQFTSTVNQEETNKEENPTAKLYYTVFPTTAGEMASIAASIEQHRQNGYAYSDHAILCQRHVQADKLAEALTIAGIPVSRLGPFFNRSEIQEVLALLTLMNEDVPLALLKLGHGRLAVATLLGLVAEYKLKLRASLKDERVLIELDEVSRQVVVELSLLLERLDGCRSMWLLVAQYLFDYSPTIAKLTQSDQDSFANRQKLRALGQLLRLVAGFDREEEAKLYQAEARKLDRPLTFEEQESLRQTSLRPSEQRQNLLRYVNALVQSDTRIELGEAEINGDNPTSAQAGRVQIITAHTSKGLEFPFVYLPGLHQPGNPPTDPTQPAPPNFHFIVEDSQREDRRCLFYVSVTRARDALYLSWAEQDEVAVEASVNEDEEVSSKGRKAVRLRQPGEGLQAALQHRENHLDSWSSLEVLDPTVNQPIIGEFSSNPALIALSENGKVPAGLDYSRLRRYEECPSRYYYQYVMQGQGSARTRSQDERSQFYQSLAAAQKHLYTNLIDAGALPDLDSLLAVYHSAWRAPAGTGKLKSADLNETVEAALAENTETSVTESAGENEAGETSESYYRLQGVKTLQALHQQHQNLPEVRPVAVEFDVPHTVRLKNNTIFFRVDRLETFADRSKRLIHSRLKALPKDESKLDNDSQKPYRLLSLYAMAYPPLAGATPHKIILEAVGPEGAMQLETPKAYKKAQTYQKWLSTNNGSPGLLDRLDKLADSIRAGNFEPKKGEHCRACPFYTLVCPVKPD